MQCTLGKIITENKDAIPESKSNTSKVYYLQKDVFLPQSYLVTSQIFEVNVTLKSSSLVMCFHKCLTALFTEYRDTHSKYLTGITQHR